MVFIATLIIIIELSPAVRRAFWQIAGGQNLRKVPLRFSMRNVAVRRVSEWDYHR